MGSVVVYDRHFVIVLCNISLYSHLLAVSTFRETGKNYYRYMANII